MNTQTQTKTGDGNAPRVEPTTNGDGGWLVKRKGFGDESYAFRSHAEARVKEITNPSFALDCDDALKGYDDATRIAFASLEVKIAKLP